MTIEQQRSEFLNLLDLPLPEQTYQEFLEEHTRFIPQHFVQNHGIGMSLVLRKLPFGADYKCDFFFFSKSTVTWHAVLIEIEKPSSRFFKGNTNELHGDFQHAINQIRQWKAWFSSDANKAGFLSQVQAIHVPAHMRDNPTYLKYILVFGRRSEIEASSHRRGLVRACETDDFKIMTFDSLAEGLTQKEELSIGIRHNEFIDIMTDNITNEGLYSWAEPTQLRVSPVLLEKLKKGTPVDGQGSKHMHFGANGGEDTLIRASKLVRVRGR